MEITMRDLAMAWRQGFRACETLHRIEENPYAFQGELDNATDASEPNMAFVDNEWWPQRKASRWDT